MVKHTVVTSLAVAILACTNFAFAQRNLKTDAAPKRAGEVRVALVIGNAAYKETPLANPVNDATDMAKALQNAGFRVILRRNAGTREMRQAIREFGDELRRADVGLLFFAGHGVQVRGNNYLIPVGADIQREADVEDLAIDASYVLRTMEDAQVKVSIVILDACRNNPFARSFRSSSRGLAQMTAATGSVIAFSTAPGSLAADGTGRNGTYTKHLLANLAGRDTDLLKVFQRTRAGVLKETGGKQTPWESTSLIGDFHFRPGTSVAAAQPGFTAVPAVSESILWQKAKDSQSLNEVEGYLASFPNGQFASLANIRITALRQGSKAQSLQAAMWEGIKGNRNKDELEAFLASYPAHPNAPGVMVRLTALDAPSALELASRPDQPLRRDVSLPPGTPYYCGVGMASEGQRVESWVTVDDDQLTSAQVMWRDAELFIREFECCAGARANPLVSSRNLGRFRNGRLQDDIVGVVFHYELNSDRSAVRTYLAGSSSVKVCRRTN